MTMSDETFQMGKNVAIMSGETISYGENVVTISDETKLFPMGKCCDDPSRSHS